MPVHKAPLKHHTVSYGIIHIPVLSAWKGMNANDASCAVSTAISNSFAAFAVVHATERDAWGILFASLLRDTARSDMKISTKITAKYARVAARMVVRSLPEKFPAERKTRSRRDAECTP